MAKYNFYYDENTHLHISSGNSGTGKGVYTLNLLSGDEPLTLEDGTVLTNISGTCHGCCDKCKSDCYAIRNQKFRSCYRNIKSWSENTIIANSNIPQLVDELNNFINNNLVSVFRFHSFGEIPSYEYLIAMNEIAKHNCDIKFYCYTKRFSWLVDYITVYGEFSPNLTILASIWDGNWDNPFELPEFIYDAKRNMQIPHCPKVDINGHETGVTCAKCKRCFSAKRGTKIAVYPH